MSEWDCQGNEDQGLIIRNGEFYPYVVKDGQVRVRLPFTVDQTRLQNLLTGDGWAVALDHQRLDSEGWGRGYDVDGYYPYWIWPDEDGTTIFAFPPRDYRPEAWAGEGVNRRPVWGRNSLDEFARWFDYLRAAATGGPGG